MFMSTEVYLKRIFYTLEHVIAPEVESDFARGQVFAVISLLEQLGSQIEYKRDIIEKDMKTGAGILREVVSALKDAGAEPPSELAKYMDGLESGGPVSLAARDRLEEMISLAIDFFHEKGSKLESQKASEVDGLVRDFITKTATRDLGLLKPPRIDQISRPKKKEPTKKES